MAKTLTLNILGFYKTILVLLLLTVTPVFGQNLISHGDFEFASGVTPYGFISDYAYYNPPSINLGNPGVYIVKGYPNTPNTYNNNFFNVGDHTSGTGKFFFANGFGSGSTARVWEQTVSVSPNTNYEFTFWATHLSNGGVPVPQSSNRAKFYVKINGTQIGSDFQPQFVYNQGNWDQSPVYSWNSGTYIQATITIYDRCAGSSNDGDDFGIDDISFTPIVTYSVDAIDDLNILACQGNVVDIDVLDNDVVTPNANDAEVSIVEGTGPSHGTYTLSNNIFHYTFSGGNSPTDQFKYRVTTHGVSDEAWVYIQTSSTPTVGNISAPGPICSGGALGISMPSVNPSATGHWEYGSSQNGTFQVFDPTNVPLSMNGKWVRYSAANGCGTGTSNAVQITVTNGPSFSGQTPQVQPICAGGSLDLTPPAFSSNGSQILGQGWVASPTETGEYSTFNLNNIPATYNGWYIRYMVEGSCGLVYSAPANQLVVGVTPVVSGTLGIPSATCAGDDLNVMAPDFEGEGTGAWEICQTQNGTYQPFDIHNVSVDNDNWYIRYKVSNNCGSDVSNAVQIHVNEAPDVAAINAPSPICAGGSFVLSTPTIQDNGATITDQGWQIQINGSWQALDNSNIPYEYNGSSIRYFAINNCGAVTSNVVQVTVNNNPTFSGQTPQLQPICAGQSLNLTAPAFNTNGSQILSEGWAVSPTETGEFVAFDLNNVSATYDGWYLCYRVEGSCGMVFSSPARQLIVGSTPVITGNLGIPPVICEGGDLDAVAPGFEGEGTGEWEICETQSGTYQPFDVHDVSSNYNNWYLHYKVDNECGADVSNAVQITVADSPGFSESTPQIQPVCEGDGLDLTPPTFSANDSQIIAQGWVASPTQTGGFVPVDVNNVSSSNNGWYICYMVESDCGIAYSTPVRQLEVDAAPEVTGALQAPDAICAGDDLVVVAPSFDGDGMGVWEACQTEDGVYQPFDIHEVSIDYNDWYIRYNVSNDCGNDVSSPAQIHVNEAPEVAAVAAPEAICAGNAFSLVTPVVQNNGSMITNQGWQIQVNGMWQDLSNNNIPYEYNECQIRYFAENGCGITYGNNLQVTVNDEPLVGEITAPAGICAGESFNLTAPQVIWRQADPGIGRWEIQINGQWQTLNNNNIPPSYNGCSIRYKASNDCGMAYSPNNVQLVVYASDPVDEGEITACDVIYHHGYLCDHEGYYTVDSITPNNCTIRVSWHFTLGEAYAAPVQYMEECESYYWPKADQTFYESNVYDVLIESDNPQVCDSTFTLDLTISHTPSILNDIQAPSAICAGAPLVVTMPQVQMNHSGGGSQRWEFATSASGPFTEFDPMTSHLEHGTYYLRFVAANECGETIGNVVPFHVEDRPMANMQLSSMQVCEGQTLDLPEVDVIWNNENENDRLTQWQMSSTPDGTFTAISPTLPMQLSYNGNWLRFMAHNSCGEYIVGPVLITVMAETEEWLETIHSCDSYTLESGDVITESQVVDYEFYDPCFRVVHQPIEITYTDHVTEYITSCHESVVWNGMTFYHSDQTQYSTVTLSNQAQCDSIVELQLDFGDYSSYTYNRAACESYVWDMNPNQVYTESVRDSVFVAAIDEEDCDTWYILNLTIGHEVMVDGGDMTECSGFVWHGVPYYADAVLYDSLLTTGTRCDSIVVHKLHVIAPVETDTSIMACNPIWWQEHFCEEEGDYQHTFQSIHGCDSIVTVHFSLSEPLLSEMDTLSCDPFRWYEHYCNTDGMTYSHLFHTPEGCDSTVLLHVSLSGAVVTTQEIMACDSYEHNGVVYDEPGIVYIDLEALQTQAGCDSIVQLKVQINDSESIGWIQGSSSVFVASNLVIGIYQYEIDTDGIEGGITWTFAEPGWQIVEAADNYCRIRVTTPGTNTLMARFIAADCGEMVRTFEINADYYDVEEQEGNGVQVYPNPTKGMITIEAEGIESIRLIDMMGQVIETIDGDRSNSVTLNLNRYAPSVYLLEMRTIGGLTQRRVTLYR